MTSDAVVRARAERRVRLGEAMAISGFDAVLVTHHTDIRWLTGFTGSAGAVLVRSDGTTILGTDDRYAETVRNGDPAQDLVVTREPLADLVVQAQSDGVRSLGLDGAHLTWRQWRDLSTIAPPHTQLRDFEALLSELRCRKDAVEVDALRRACNLTDAAVASILDHLRPGVTEREIAKAFLRALDDLGADGPSFPPIVAGGPHAAVPHHEPGMRKFARGDVVVLDVGARVDGYCADMSRTVALGTPDPQLLDIHRVVARAQTAAREQVCAGVSAGSVDAAARRVITEAGFGDRFLHGTGHGVGLDIHEPPILRAEAAGILGESFAVTVEPGIYLPGLGGVRIEDVVLVGATGAETLTSLPRDLVVL